MIILNRLPLAGLALGLLAATPPPALAQATGTDITRMTCSQFTDMPRGDQEQLLTWLYGYYSGAAQRAVIDRGTFLGAARTVGDYCSKQKAMPLISAQIRAIFLPGGQGPDAQQPGAADAAARPAPGAGPSVSGPAVLAPTAEGAQRITIPPTFDPAITSALPRPGGVSPSQSLIDTLSSQPQIVPTRPTPQ